MHGVSFCNTNNARAKSAQAFYEGSICVSYYCKNPINWEILIEIKTQMLHYDAFYVSTSTDVFAVKYEDNLSSAGMQMWLLFRR